MSSKIFVCRKTLGKFQLVIFLLFVFTITIVFDLAAQSSQIIYVKKGATSPGDGSSWNTAYTDLQQALTAATALPGNKEIWVARGEYKPTATLDRNISFVMPANTILYGGFEGNETSSAGRNWRNNRTVLSGDLGAQFDKADNSYHVAVFTGAIQNSVIDGFIIKEGNADVEDDQVTNKGHGGGILISNVGQLSANPKIINCHFLNNGAILGGGICIQGNASPHLLNCVFDGNQGQLGGALFNSGSSSSSTSVINCIFSTNSGQFGGGAISNFRRLSVVNSTIVNNKSQSNGSACINTGDLEVFNSILWKNYEEGLETPNYLFSIVNLESATKKFERNIIQGGYGEPEDNNIDADPLFEKEPSFLGIYPRTSIIPVTTTDPKYENVLSFSGPKMNGPWPYYAYKDHSYNKLYLPGRNLQIIDFSNISNNQPTSTVYGEVNFGSTQRLEKSVHTSGNKIYFASYFSGIVSIDRATGQLINYDPLAGEPVTYPYAKVRDLVVDDTNNLLYAPVFYNPGNVFYGILELNLTTQAKRWITTASTPIAISVPVSTMDHDVYWGGFRMYLDEPANTFYFSTGNGVWWWNRGNNTTGIISTSGGIPLASGSPNLPSNLTTGMYMDHSENKFYIGTHEGLFVWNRNDNTTRIYNTINSKLAHNLINHIDKNDEYHLIYVACEEGGLFVINTQTGEEKLITEDVGNEIHPQFMDAAAASVHYDEVDKKLYVSADHTSGGVWIQDYNNLIPDYGDLRLKAGSPAIDKGNAGFLPSGVTTDIAGLNRFVNYTSIEGENSLDLGAHERAFNEDDPNPPLAISDNNYILTFSPVTEVSDESSVESLSVRRVNKNITYFDGLGRPMQSTSIQGSPDKQDVITPIVYDELGREVRKYLPFVAGNNGSYRPNGGIIDSSHNYTGIALPFYAENSDNKVADDPRPYSEIFFEPSPLNRPDKEYGPGLAWAAVLGGNDKSVRHQYLSNVHSNAQSQDAEALIAWKVDEQGLPAKEADVEDHIVDGGYYDSNQIYIKNTVDEHGNAVREYTNKQGRVILKKVQVVANSTNLNSMDDWACTYYIYDDLGNLRFVLPPEGVKQYLELTAQN
jgi:hypothetical protein